MRNEAPTAASRALLVAEVVGNDDLERRPVRVPDYRAQSHALAQLVETLATEPALIADRLVRAAISLLGAESSGLSLEEGMDGPDPKFRWVATAGEFERYLGGTLPRHFSPCGTVVAGDCPMLMIDPQRAFPYVADLHAPCREVLLAPFHRDGVAIGTLWAVFHSAGKRFDAEDRRVLISLAKYAEIAIQTAGTLEALRSRAAHDATVIARTRDEVRVLREWFDRSPGFCARLSGPTHVFDAVNEACLDLIGGRNPLGRTVGDALPELSEQGFERLLDEVYLTGRPYVGRNVEVRLRNRADRPAARMWLDFVYQPIRAMDGNVVGILVQGHDVTDGHLAIERMREADRNKDQFIATLAHELRNPLSPIKVAVQVLKRTSASSDPAAAKMLEVIDRQSGNMSAMVDGLMDIAAIRTGKVVLRRAPTHLQEVAARSLEAVQEALSHKGHALEVSLPPEPLIVSADALRLTQALTNLLANAAKYTPDEGTISLTLHVDAGRPTFVVSDNGQGIDAERAPHVFDMFMQGSTYERPAGGLGIGLAVVRQVMELHGGGVEARSAGIGKGSRFSIWLPATAI